MTPPQKARNPKRKAAAPSRKRKAATPARPKPGDPNALAARIGITLNNPEILRQALTHKSAQQELNLPSNERLEFLGDAVLGLVVATYVYRKHPDLPEGDLTKLKAVAVSEPTLSRVAAELDLGRHLLLAKGEEQSGGRKRPSILADALEAVFAAIYLDRGLTVARRLILDLLSDDISAIERAEHEPDYKTLLQEKIQERHRTPPSYRVIDEQGPDHDRTFACEVRVVGRVLGRGVGKSKKQAEQAAAKEALASS
jgi:ribonuclease-3